MLLDKTPHRDLVIRVRNQFAEDIPSILELDQAHLNYIRAKTAFSIVDNDETFVNLNGTWSRLSRIMRQMEDKYANR